MLEAMRKLSDAEVGRLFRGLLYYSMTEEHPDNLQGREELLFDVFSQNIDREIQKYNERCKTNKIIATNRNQSLRIVTNRDDSHQEKEKDKDKEKDKEKDKDNIHTPSRAASELQPGFVEFWKTYPNKVKKSNAIAAWKSGKCEPIADRIIADVKERCLTEWKDQDIHFIPHPTTYLHQRRWEDETPPTERKEQGRSKEWHNPALDYAQRDYTGTKPKPERVYMTFDDEEG
jgi:hypothetical protein